jgi:hypothetical protein
MRAKQTTQTVVLPGSKQKRRVYVGKKGGKYVKIKDALVPIRKLVKSGTQKGGMNDVPVPPTKDMFKTALMKFDWQRKFMQAHLLRTKRRGLHSYDDFITSLEMTFKIFFAEGLKLTADRMGIQITPDIVSKLHQDTSLSELRLLLLRQSIIERDLEGSTGLHDTIQRIVIQPDVIDQLYSMFQSLFRIINSSGQASTSAAAAAAAAAPNTRIGQARQTNNQRMGQQASTSAAAAAAAPTKDMFKNALRRFQWQKAFAFAQKAIFGNTNGYIPTHDQLMISLEGAFRNFISKILEVEANRIGIPNPYPKFISQYQFDTSVSELRLLLLRQNIGKQDLEGSTGLHDTIQRIIIQPDVIDELYSMFQTLFRIMISSRQASTSAAAAAAAAPNTRIGQARQTNNQRMGQQASTSAAAAAPNTRIGQARQTNKRRMGQQASTSAAAAAAAPNTGIGQARQTNKRRMGQQASTSAAAAAAAAAPNTGMGQARQTNNRRMGQQASTSAAAAAAAAAPPNTGMGQQASTSNSDLMKQARENVWRRMGQTFTDNAGNERPSETAFKIYIKKSLKFPIDPIDFARVMPPKIITNRKEFVTRILEKAEASDLANKSFNILRTIDGIVTEINWLLGPSGHHPLQTLGVGHNPNSSLREYILDAPHELPHLSDLIERGQTLENIKKYLEYHLDELWNFYSSLLVRLRIITHDLP